MNSQTMTTVTKWLVKNGFMTAADSKAAIEMFAAETESKAKKTKSVKAKAEPKTKKTKAAEPQAKKTEPKAKKAKAEPKTKKTEAATEDIEYNNQKALFQKMKVAELKAELAKNELSTSGTKAVLVARCLQGWDNFRQDEKNCEKAAQAEEILQPMIRSMITDDLTTGRDNLGLKPYDETQIAEFITANINKIYKVVSNMISTYDADGDLELLQHPELDWVREFLYEEITTITDEEIENAPGYE